MKKASYKGRGKTILLTVVALGVIGAVTPDKEDADDNQQQEIVETVDNEEKETEETVDEQWDEQGETASQAEQQQPVSPPKQEEKPKPQETQRPQETQPIQQQEHLQDPPQEKEPHGRTVYVTETGKRYHYDSNCGNGTYYPCDLKEAEKTGLTPCEKCVLN